MKDKILNKVIGLSILMFIIWLLSGCVTQKKVDTYLAGHPEYEAKHCADRFPVVPSTTTSEYFDSSAYNNLVEELQAFADSVINEKAGRSYVMDTFFSKRINDPLFYQDAKPIDTGGSMVYHYDYNFPLKKAIQEKLKSSLKPCVDKIITKTNTVVDEARVKALELENASSRIENQDKTARIELQQKEIKETKAEKRKWFWLFWGLVVVIVGWSTRKLWMRLIVP